MKELDNEMNIETNIGDQGSTTTTVGYYHVYPNYHQDAKKMALDTANSLVTSQQFPLQKTGGSPKPVFFTELCEEIYQWLIKEDKEKDE
jgi:hypothetical protein